LLQELGPSDFATLQVEHRQLLQVAMAAHGGYEVDSQGDSSFMVFAAASSAVAAAVAAQRAMAAHPWPTRQSGKGTGVLCSDAGLLARNRGISMGLCGDRRSRCGSVLRGTVGTGCAPVSCNGNVSPSARPRPQ
jgi:hypothetical protein